MVMMMMMVKKRLAAIFTINIECHLQFLWLQFPNQLLSHIVSEISNSIWSTSKCFTQLHFQSFWIPNKDTRTQVFPLKIDGRFWMVFYFILYLFVCLFILYLVGVNNWSFVFQNNIYQNYWRLYLITEQRKKKEKQRTTHF